MMSDRDEHNIAAHDLDADDGPGGHDWTASVTKSVTKAVNVALFIMNLYLLYLMFSFIM